jgi:hypothetical protein
LAEDRVAPKCYVLKEVHALVVFDFEIVIQEKGLSRLQFGRKYKSPCRRSLSLITPRLIFGK